jgi:hypothetical protein
VSFTIRGGRLTGWTHRACGEATARRHLERTPPDWVRFAQRNAELAARLTGRHPPDARVSGVQARPDPCMHSGDADDH